MTLVGPQRVFVIYGMVGLARGSARAARCRACARPSAMRRRAARGRWTPSPLNILFFVVALGADGVFTATHLDIAGRHDPGDRRR